MFCSFQRDAEALTPRVQALERLVQERRSPPRVPSSFVSGVPYIQGTLSLNEKSVRVRVMLDSGCAFQFVLKPSLADFFGLEAAAQFDAILSNDEARPIIQLKPDVGLTVTREDNSEVRAVLTPFTFAAPMAAPSPPPGAMVAVEWIDPSMYEVVLGGDGMTKIGLYANHKNHTVAFVRRRV